MSSSSAAMELKVLISVLQSGQVLPNLLNQVNQLSQGLTKLQNQTGAPGQAAQQSAQGFQQLAQQGKQATAEMMTLNKAIADVGQAIRFMTGGFLAFQSVRFIKSLADTAARAEVLQTTLHVVSRNAGVLTSEVDKLDAKVQSMGITAESSRQSLIQMFQAKLDVSWAPKLARAAQDLAVVSNMNSSDTFRRLLLNIQQMDTMGLRMMGVVVNRDQAMKKYAETNNTVVKSLTRQQQQEAFMIETHKQLLTLEGAYVASMDNVGKQLQSLDRLTTTLKQTVGDLLLPAYSAIIRELGYFYEDMTLVAKVMVSNKEEAQELGEIIGEWARSLREAMREGVKWLQDYGGWILKVVEWALILKTVLLGLRGIAWLGAGAQAVITFLTNATSGLAAYRAGTIGLTTAMELLRVKTVAAGQELIAKEVLLKGMTSTVGATTTAVAGLTTGWMGLLAAMATAAVGTVVYLVYLQAKKPLDQQVAEMGRQIKQAAEASPPVAQGEFGPQGGIAGRAGTNYRIAREREFRDWQLQRKELVADIERENKLTRPKGGLFALAPDADIAAGTADPLSKRFLQYEQQLTEVDRLIQATKDRNEALAILQRKKEELAVMVKTATEMEVEAGKDLSNQGARSMALGAADQYKTAKKELEALEQSFADRFKETPAQAGTRRLEEAVDAVRKAADVARLANRGTNADASKKAMADLTAAKALQTQREEELAGLLTKYAGMDVSKAAEEAKTAAKTLEVEADRKLQDQIAEARTKEGIGPKYDFTSGREELVAFGEALKDFDLIMQGLAKSDSPEKIQENMGVLGRVLKNMQANVTDATMGQFQQRVEAFRKGIGLLTDSRAIAEARVTASQALGRGQLNARQERLQFGAPLVEEARDRARRTAAPEIALAEEAFTKAKVRGDNQNTLLEEQYRKNLIGLRTYTEGRIQVIEESFAYEKDLAQQRLDLEKSLQTIAERSGDPKAIDAAANAVRGAETNLQSVITRREQELGRLNDQRRTGQEDFEKEIKESLLNLQAEIGSDADILAALNYKLEQQFKKYHAAGDQIDSNAVRLELLTGINEALKTQLQLIERRYQLESGRRSGVRASLDLEQGRLDREGAKVNADQAAGRITTTEAMRLRNRLIMSQLDKDAIELAEKQIELQQLQNKYETEYAAIVKTQQELAKVQGLSEEQAAEALSRALLVLSPLQQQLVAAQLAIENLQQATDLAKDKIESYGKELAEVFKVGLTDAITDAILNLKNQEGKLLASLNSFADAVKRKIANVYAQAITEKIMQLIPKGVFELPFKLLGVKREGDGKTAANPMYVTVVKNDAKGNLEQNFGESALKPLFVTEVDPPDPTVLPNVVTTNIQNIVTGVGMAGGGGGSGLVSRLANMGLGWLFGGHGGRGSGSGSGGGGGGLNTDAGGMAEGGTVIGPGTGTSDSIPAMLSAGEHIMPAAKAARFMPLLEGIRLGKILPFASGGVVQSIAIPSIIPHRYAMGGVVTADGGASQVETAAGGGGPLLVQLHPDVMDMTMREWLEREVVRQHGRR